MSNWSTYTRATGLFWARFTNLHNRSRKGLRPKKVSDLIINADKFAQEMERVCDQLGEGDAPLDLSKLDKAALFPTLYKMTYFDASKAFGKAVSISTKAEG